MIRMAFRKGWQLVWENKIIAFLFYGVTVVLALFIAIPVHSAFEVQVGRSLLGNTLLGGLNLDVVMEIFRYQKEFLPMTFGVLTMIAVVWWVVEQMLMLGTVATFASHEPYRAKPFWGTAADMFLPLVRLSLWSLPVFAILIAGPHFLMKGIAYLFFGPLPYENIAYVFSKIQGFLRQLGLLVGLMVFHYARVHLIVHSRKVTRESIWASMRFVVQRFNVLFTFAIAIFLAGIILLLGYRLLASLLTFAHPISVILMIIVQQIYILCRLGLMLLGTAGEVILFQRLFSP